MKHKEMFCGTPFIFPWFSECWQFDSGSSAFSKSSLNIWKFTVHILLKPGLGNFKHYFASVWDECNCAVVWAFFFFFFFKFLFIYLSALGLSCSMWDLAPRPGIEPGPPALGAQGPSHWTTRELPSLSILWHCLSLGLEWKLTFSSPEATAEFSKFAGILSAALSQHHLLEFETAPLEFHHLH